MNLDSVIYACAYLTLTDLNQDCDPSRCLLVNVTVVRYMANSLSKRAMLLNTGLVI